MAFSYRENSKISGRRNLFGPALQLNGLLENDASSGLINERSIETRLECLQSDVSGADPCFWLLMARLTELATVCAGRYADGCEFTAAGDLIVNPREIRVHVCRATPSTVIKNRHGALSAQFNTLQRPQDEFKKWFQKTAVIEIVKAPLLTFFLETLETSQFFSEDYLDNVRWRMGRIAGTLAFLGSWHIADAADLHRKLSAATPETRQFVESHLCQFDLNHFTAMGQEMHCRFRGQDGSGNYLRSPGDPVGAHGLQRETGLESRQRAAARVGK